MSFKEFDLHPNLLRALEACNFTTPTEIQNEAIPVVMSGADLIASAQTGTGKTAAFVLPILHRLNLPPTVKGNGPRVLVLTPTRELADQINKDVQMFSKFSHFTSGNVLGGMPYPPQIRLLRNKLDLLVATPGRLQDHMNEGRLDFSRLEVFVLDEADRMLDMGFVNAVKQIAAKLPRKRQTLLFSATIDRSVLSVATVLMDQPKQIELSHRTKAHLSIDQSAYLVDSASHKHSVLKHHLSCETVTQAIIFTTTKRGADSLARALNDDGFKTACLHGDMRQNARQRTVDKLKKGQVKLLVATDVAARGLDIKGVSHVFNFELPNVTDDYIHRIGRTGRAGAEGKAIALVGPSERSKLFDIERKTGKPMERATIPGLEPKLPEIKRKPGGVAGRSFRPFGKRPRRRKSFA